MQWLIDIIKEWVQLYLKDIIVLWSGAIVDIPDGWHLCDGTKGTPDLRDKFIMGAGWHFDPADEGGADSHTHDFTSDTHYHIIESGEDIAAGANYDSDTTEEVATGTTDSGNNLPRYYSLCYIMKL